MVLVRGPVQYWQHTDCFTAAYPPVGQKTSLNNFKHKIKRLELTIQTALVHDIPLMTKNCVCIISMVKESKTTSNYTCTDAVMKRVQG